MGAGGVSERKQALQELRDKVAEGVKYETMGHTVMCQKAFPKPDGFDGSRESYAKSEAQQAILVWRNGSLDAAQALHEAVLPRWVWCIDFRQSWIATVGFEDIKHSSDTPARAWLLCIIDALIAEADNG